MHRPSIKEEKHGTVTYSMDREDGVSKDIFIVCLTGSGTISIDAKQLQISYALQKQNGSV